MDMFRTNIIGVEDMRENKTKEFSDSSPKKRRNRSESPSQNQRKTKKLKDDDNSSKFFMNTKPDHENLALESSYKVPIYRSVFLDHRVKDKNPDMKEWRYFSKKHKASLLQDMKTNNTVDSQMSSEKTDQDLGASVEMKTKNFNETLTKEPMNVDLWIRFVHFQDEKLKSDMKLKDFKSSTDKRILNEIKMAVIEDALKKNPRNLALSLLRLEIGEMLWEREKVEKCWKDLISKGRLEASFWRKYLNFVRRRFEGFTVGKMLETYKECFRFLRARAEEDLDVLKELMDFLWETLNFLDGAGYTETCVAIYQLMFELNINIPDNLRYLPFPDKLDFLSAYWSGFQPKFGEDKWVGWKAWVEMMGKTAEFVQPWSSKDVDEDNEFKLIANHHDSRPISWFNIETYRSGHHWCSWRPEREDDEDGEHCEDEDRMVAFDDISGFLFFADSEDFRFKIVWRFLDFLMKRSKNFCFGNFASSNTDPTYTSFKEIFLNPEEFSSSTENLEYVNKMIANVFDIAIAKFEGQQKRLFLHRYINHVMHSEDRQKELRKIFKNILKDNNDDFMLWMKYARFERVCGKADLANKVIETTLMSVANVMPLSKKQSSELLLRRCKIDFEIGFGCSISCEGCSLFKKNKMSDKVLQQDTEKILKLFNWLSDSEADGPSGILKIKKTLEKNVEDSLNELQFSTSSVDDLALHFFQHDILHLVHLLSVFVFLTTSSISNFLSIYSGVMNRLRDISKDKPLLEKQATVLHQLLSRNRLRFLDFCEGSVFIPRSTRISAAVEDVERHPTDAILIENFYQYNLSPSMMAGNEVMKLVFGENNLLCLKLQHIKSLIRKFVSFSETGLQVESIANQLKNFFEICLSSKTSSCTLTWSIYLYFHNMVKNSEKSTRKFFRAIEALPESKMLYMQSILYNPDMLVRILKTMDSKEIRLRTLKEEVTLFISSYKILHVTT